MMPKPARDVIWLLRECFWGKNSLIHLLKSIKRYSLEHKTSDIPLDIAMVTIDKDIETLQASIDSIKKYIMHPIKQIAIVTRNDDFFISFCKKNGYVFIDENDILGYSKENFNNMEGRGGWLFQQLLKLGYAQYSASEHYLVVDSDTVFLKKRIFKDKNITFFDYSDEHHRPYRIAFNKLMGFDYCSNLSFVTHYMLFEKKKVGAFKRFIEEKHSCRWDEAILKCADYSHSSCFSEYETYGNFFSYFYKKEIRRYYWFNQVVVNLSKLYTKNSPFVRSVSCHAFSREN
jgi:hypothetical protein